MSAEFPDLAALELFVTVADEGSIGAGARRLGIAQPNASRMLRQLEGTAGAALLRRGHRGTVMTARGESLFASARALVDDAHRLSAALDARDELPFEDVRVAASMTVAESLLPKWLPQWQRRVPHARIGIEVFNSSRVISGVANFDVDLGFVETPHLPVGINASIVAEDELAVLVSPEHPWAERCGRVTLAELARTPLIVRERGSGTREALEQLLLGCEAVDPAQVLHNNTAVRTGVLATGGPAVLSQLAVESQLASGELLRVPLDAPAQKRPLTAIWSGSRRPVGTVADLLAIVAE